MPDDSKLQAVLRRAFANSSFARTQTQLTHEQCVHVRADLMMVQPSDIPHCLGHLLVDLLITHRKDLDPDGADGFVRYLDGYWPSGTDQDSLDEAMRCASLRQAKLAGFSYLTPQECQAVHLWLLEAKDWRCLKLWQEDVLSAIRFWSRVLEYGFESVDGSLSRS